MSIIPPAATSTIGYGVIPEIERYMSMRLGQEIAIKWAKIMSKHRVCRSGEFLAFALKTLQESDEKDNLKMDSICAIFYVMENYSTSRIHLPVMELVDKAPHLFTLPWPTDVPEPVTCGANETPENFFKALRALATVPEETARVLVGEFHGSWIYSLEGAEVFLLLAETLAAMGTPTPWHARNLFALAEEVDIADLASIPGFDLAAFAENQLNPELLQAMKTLPPVTTLLALRENRFTHRNYAPVAVAVALRRDLPEGKLRDIADKVYSAPTALAVIVNEDVDMGNFIGGKVSH